MVELSKTPKVKNVSKIESEVDLAAKDAGVLIKASVKNSKSQFTRFSASRAADGERLKFYSGSHSKF